MAKREDINKVLVIGAGAVNIGGAGQLDFMANRALQKIRSMGYKTVIINPDAQAVSNNPGSADAVYAEPLNIETIKKIIIKERPDCILPVFGGKIAMTLCHELAVTGVLSEYGIKVAGVPVYAMECCEDAVKFKNIMDSLGIATHEGIVVHTVEEAERAAQKYNYHVVIRSPYSIYSNTNSLVFNKEELKRFVEPVLNSSLSASALISEALIERNEYEFEVMRDSKNNMITIASVENINPLDVHSNDSAIVSPAVTLSEKEYKQMENAAYRIVEAMQIVGFADVRFAKDPKDGSWVVVKVTPFLSRITSYAADINGIDMAEAASEVIFGASLTEIICNGKTMAEYKEKKDCYAVRVPVFPFDAFPDAIDILDTKMRSVGSALGIGKSFREALHKALRGAEQYGLGLLKKMSKEDLLSRLITPSSKDLCYIYEALRKSASVEEISSITCIDEYFVKEMQELLLMENRLLKYRGRIPVEPVIIKAKKEGFSDKYIGKILSVDEKDIRNNLVDIEAEKNVIKINNKSFSITYHTAEKPERLEGKTALIVGGGSNSIGRSSELKFAAVMGAKALKKLGYKTIYINPGDVSEESFDRVYIEAISEEDVIKVCSIEKPDVIITQFAGKKSESITKALEDNGFKAAGVTGRSYDLISDEIIFREMVSNLGIWTPKSEISTDIDEALAIAENIGYPVSVLSSTETVGKTIYTSGEMLIYLEMAEISEEKPVKIENFLFSAIECEIDAIVCGGKIYIPEMMEHIESAGINSGDSACVIPPRNISEKQKTTIYQYAESFVRELGISGCINMQFAVDKDKIYLLKVSLGASRTLPFVAKMCGIDMIESAVLAMLNGKPEMGAIKNSGMTGVKEVICPWNVFDECDPIMGPNMHSTGSVMTLGNTFGEAFFKSQEAVDSKLPLEGSVFINLSERDNKYLVKLCKEFISAGFKIFTTMEHFKELRRVGIKSERVKRISEGRPNIQDSIINGEVDIVVNTALGDSYIRRSVIRNSIAYMTTAASAFAAVSGIKAAKAEENFQPAELI